MLVKLQPKLFRKTEVKTTEIYSVFLPKSCIRDKKARRGGSCEEILCKVISTASFPLFVHDL